MTYLPLPVGFMYLVVVMDWYSRYVLSWELSNTLEAGFCVDALETALQRQRPEIFNSDQGAHYTRWAFTHRLQEAAIKISMDGRGRVFDNIFVERFWRTLKYEDIYLKDYASVLELLQGVSAYIEFYNEQRPHQALGYLTPGTVYPGGSGCSKQVPSLS